MSAHIRAIIDQVDEQHREEAAKKLEEKKKGKASTETEEGDTDQGEGVGDDENDASLQEQWRADGGGHFKLGSKQDPQSLGEFEAAEKVVQGTAPANKKNLAFQHLHLKLGQYLTHTFQSNNIPFPDSGSISLTQDFMVSTCCATFVLFAWMPEVSFL